MRNLITALSLAAATVVTTLPVAATAQQAERVRVRVGTQLLSADGQRMGRVVHVTDRSVSIAIGSRFVFIPIDTLTMTDSVRVTTSLTRDQIRAMR